MPVGVIRYATILSFWTMVIIWEIEIMRVFGKMSAAREVDIRNAIGWIEYDSTMLLLAVFTFVSSIFYMATYRKRFGILAMLISFFFITVALITGKGIVNFELIGNLV